MSVIRVNKTKDYTIISNFHLKEKYMTLKAKGLLSLMLSLPDDWEYSISGLVNICKENESAIKSTLKELNDFGYLKITKLMPNNSNTGRIEYIYDIFEKPYKKQDIEKQGVENQPLENQPLENQPLENQGQLNTNISNTNILNTNNKEKIYKKEKHKYGEYKNVLLTDDELEKLKERFTNWEDKIKQLDEGIELKGYKYKSHYLAIIKWSEKEQPKEIKREYTEFWEE